MPDIVVNIIANNAIINSPNQSETNGVLTQINNVIGVLGNWIQVGSFAASLLEQALGNVPDPTTLLEDINTGVQQLLLNQGADTTHVNMLTVNTLITTAMVNLDTLRIDGKSSSAVNESQFISNAQTAAFIFKSNDYWIRPYLTDITFFDGWFPNNAQPPVVPYEGASWVFDPNLPLLAFITAINIFTVETVLFFAGTDLARAQAPFFTDLATYLETYYKTAVDGLQMVPVPELDDLTFLVDHLVNAVDGESLPTSMTPAPLGAFWHGELGAVDIYAPFARPGVGSTGYPNPWQATTAGLRFVETVHAGAVMGVYPTIVTLIGSFLTDLVSQRNIYRWFRIRMRIGNLARFKALYLAKGYGQVWSLVQNLRVLSAGQPGTPESGSLPPTPPPEVIDRNQHWFLSEFDPIISELDKDPNFGGGYMFENFGPGPPQTLIITAEDIITRLQAVIDNATNYPTDAPTDPVTFGPRDTGQIQRIRLQRPLSLRSVIAAVAV